MRRIRVREVVLGEVPIEASEAHHARDVLRLKVGEPVEVFDEAGRRGSALVSESTRDLFQVRVERVSEAPLRGLEWIVASAVPKGARVDWMIEKLSELGASAFVPLATERSVVLPEGRGKRERWERIASEAAKQSRRTGVMRIEALIGLPEFLARPRDGAGWVFSTGEGAGSVEEALKHLRDSAARSLTMLVGPEGGWSEGETRLLAETKWLLVSLGRTILRVETAAVAAGVIAAALAAPGPAA